MRGMVGAAPERQGDWTPRGVVSLVVLGFFCPKLVGSHQQVIFEADWCQKCPLWARPLGVLAVQR